MKNKASKTRLEGWPMLVDPHDIMKKYLDEEVAIRLKDGAEHNGVLKGYDEHSNVLVQCGGETVFIKGECILLVGQQE